MKRWRKVIILTIVCFVPGSSLLAQQTASVDHSRWDKLLKATVSEEGWVDYEEIMENRSETLLSYINLLGEVDVDRLASDSERKAFWINAYNAVTIQTLIDEGLPEKVPHAFFFGKNIFTQETYRIAGKVRTLDEVEHEILRKRYEDPRIHAALCCGAISCPRLRPEAYTGEKLNQQLDEEARRWIQTGRNKKGRKKNFLDKEKNTFYVSEIFKWFEEDFGGGEEGVKGFLLRFADEETGEYLKDNEVKIRYLDYDWSLNSQMGISS